MLLSSLEQRGGESPGPGGQGHSPVCSLWAQSKTARDPLARYEQRGACNHPGPGRTGLWLKDQTVAGCLDAGRRLVKRSHQGTDQSCADSLPLWPVFHFLSRG